MFFLVITIICILALLIGSFTDLKSREVPDILSYSLIFLGIILRAGASVIKKDSSFLVSGALGFAFFLILSLLLFYTGQWGGGDSKLLMGLGAMMGLEADLSSFMINFMIYLCVAGIVYGLFFSFYIAIKNWNSFKKGYSSKKNKIVKLIFNFAILFAAVISYFSVSEEMKVPVLASLLGTIILFNIFVFLRVVEKSCMLKKIHPKKLSEGDWITDKIMVKGKIIYDPKELGVSKEQIQELKKLYSRSLIGKIEIKDGIPFVPAFFIAYILTLIFQDYVMNLLIISMI